MAEKYLKSAEIAAFCDIDDSILRERMPEVVKLEQKNVQSHRIFVKSY